MNQHSGAKSHLFSGGPHIMGVVNVTPDSFSDGGKYINPDKAIEHGLRLLHEGASILDVGGESTRPGAEPVDIEEEIRRVVPVIEGLRPYTDQISIDSRNAKVMEAALRAGATIINDISALSYDSRSVGVVAEAQGPVFFMHSKGNPQSMQENPFYNNVVEEVFEYLQRRISFFETNRIEVHRLVSDPGIGFGKTLEHNLLLLRNIKKFHDLGVPVMLGISRKSFIARLSEGEPAHDRIPGSIAAALWGLSQDVQFYRVHDVAETKQAFKIYQAIKGTEIKDVQV